MTQATSFAKTCLHSEYAVCLCSWAFVCAYVCVFARLCVCAFVCLRVCLIFDTKTRQTGSDDRLKYDCELVYLCLTWSS